MDYKFKKKPTIREVAGVTIELGKRVNSLMGFVSELEKAFSLYVEMNNDVEKFKNHIDERFAKLEKETNDAKTNGDTDGDNLPGNSKDEGSGSEGIREEK
jgi:hypothetical protein